MFSPLPTSLLYNDKDNNSRIVNRDDLKWRTVKSSDPKNHLTVWVTFTDEKKKNLQDPSRHWGSPEISETNQGTPI